MGEACIREPTLPRGRVTLAAVSSLAAETIAALERCGVACLPVEPCPALAVPVQAHADMVCHPLGGRRVLAARGCEHLLASLRAEGFLPEETQRAPAARYPGDVLLNAARIGPLCLGSAHCDETLLRFCEEENIRFVPVRQGYAKCSTVIVSREAVVTADPSIAAAAEGCGLDVLRIRPGFVELPGYSCGFPGGAGAIFQNGSYQLSYDRIKARLRGLLRKARGKNHPSSAVVKILDLLHHANADRASSRYDEHAVCFPVYGVLESQAAAVCRASICQRFGMEKSKISAQLRNEPMAELHIIDAGRFISVIWIAGIKARFRL